MSDDADQTEQLRGIVGTVLPPDLRDSFVEYARLDAFRDESGEIDTERVMGHLTAINLATQRQQSQRNWGQGTGQPPGTTPGDQARSALEKRHGVKSNNDQPAAGAGIRLGDAGRAAAARRHGGGKR